MTKDGRPSRISDIRYFFGDKHNYLEGHNDVVAFGRRMAWFLNGEDFSLGAYPALYICLRPSLQPGIVEVTEYGGDWWQRYTNVGVPEDFQRRPDASEIAMSGTVAALKAIRPDRCSIIDYADKIVRLHGDDLRFLLKTRRTKRFTIEISFTIAVWPELSFLFVSLVDHSSGAFLEAPPIQMQIYLDAFHLAGSIKVDTTKATVLANKSVGARLTALRHGGSLVKTLSDFVPTTRPLYSKQLKRR
jgi:hypothetical protein